VGGFDVPLPSSSSVPPKEPANGGSKPIVEGLQDLGDRFEASNNRLGDVFQSALAPFQGGAPVPGEGFIAGRRRRRREAAEDQQGLERGTFERFGLKGNESERRQQRRFEAGPVNDFSTFGKIKGLFGGEQLFTVSLTRLGERMGQAAFELDRIVAALGALGLDASKLKIDAGSGRFGGTAQGLGEKSPGPVVAGGTFPAVEAVGIAREAIQEFGGEAGERRRRRETARERQKRFHEFVETGGDPERFPSAGGGQPQRRRRSHTVEESREAADQFNARSDAIVAEREGRQRPTEAARAQAAAAPTGNLEGVSRAAGDLAKAEGEQTKAIELAAASIIKGLEVAKAATEKSIQVLANQVNEQSRIFQDWQASGERFGDSFSGGG
jgi:hypothetical protein